MIMINENEERILDKINFFLSENIKVHVEKKDKLFLNGYFIKPIKDGIWKFNDDKFGELYLFLSNIYDVDEFREVGG